jgi:hypothetical protein
MLSNSYILSPTSKQEPVTLIDCCAMPHLRGTPDRRRFKRRIGTSCGKYDKYLDWHLHHH